VAGNGTCACSGDGGPAVTASLDGTDGIALDYSGNIHTIDTVINNGQYAYRIRKIDISGTINTIYSILSGYNPQSYYQSADLVIDDSGNTYFYEWPRMWVRKISQNGTRIVVAGNGGYWYPIHTGDGGPATQAPIGEISAITVDRSGNLYIVMHGAPGGSIKKVDRYGVITTIAGADQSGWQLVYGDGGLAMDAGMHYPNDIHFDPEGNLLVADEEIIRKIFKSQLRPSRLIQVTLVKYVPQGSL
jgi:hypothetical protein